MISLTPFRHRRQYPLHILFIFCLILIPHTTIAQTSDTLIEDDKPTRTIIKRVKLVAAEWNYADIYETDDETDTSSIDNQSWSLLTGVTYNLPNVDESQVQEAWLWWINAERATKWLDPLTLDHNLNNSSTEWSNYLADNKQFSNMHKRPWQKVYYSTETIMGRAQSLYLIDDSINLIAESVLWWSYSCQQDDCTQSFINRSKWKTWWPSGFLGFLMGEKRYNGVHYRMMMSPVYTKVWFGFTSAGKHPKYPSRWNQYIAVIHYGN